jgi:hypothetical protein
MSDEEIFRTPPQELEVLRKEIAEVKAVLREVAARLVQIERHAKRAFGVPAAKTKGTLAQNAGQRTLAEEKPTIEASDVMPLFDELTEVWRTHGADKVSGRLEGMPIPDLKLVARELGVTFSSKPSRKLLLSGILGRVNESVMLSRNTNVTKPRSADPVDHNTPAGEPKAGS